MAAAAARKDIAEAEIILAMAHAKKIASLYAKPIPNIDADELTSVAYEAVAEAVKGFDASKSSLPSRVEYLVRRRIIDYKRKMDWVGRHGRRLLKQRFKEELLLDGQKHLTFDYVGPDPGMPVSLDYESISGTTILGLVESKEESPEQILERIEQRDYLNRLMSSSLSKRHIKIVEAYFFQGLTMKQVGVLFGVNESRVSQIVSRAIAVMRLRANGENYESRIEDNQRRSGSYPIRREPGRRGDTAGIVEDRLQHADYPDRSTRWWLSLVKKKQRVSTVPATPVV